MSTFPTWCLLIALLGVSCQTEQKEQQQPEQKPVTPAHLLSYEGRLVTDLTLPGDTLSSKTVPLPRPLLSRFDQLVDQYVLKGLDSSGRTRMLREISYDTQLLSVEKNLFLCVLHVKTPDQNRFLSFLYNAKTDQPSTQDFVWSAESYHDTTQPVLSRPYVYVKTDSLVIREKQHDGAYGRLASNYFTYSMSPELQYQKTKPF